VEAEFSNMTYEEDLCRVHGHDLSVTTGMTYCDRCDRWAPGVYDEVAEFNEKSEKGFDSKRVTRLKQLLVEWYLDDDGVTNEMTLAQVERQERRYNQLMGVGITEFG
jgi:hypothetical protein